MPDEKEIFHIASAISDMDARAAYLAKACDGDSAMRSQIESLLVAFEDPDEFLDQNAPLTSLLGDVVSKPLEHGDQVGAYVIHDRIGEGGFGVVYEAEQQRPIKRLVAIKVIKLGMDTEQVVARFEAERQTLAIMEHPNIAKVLDAGTTRWGRPYFVMELVDGKPITDCCIENRLSLEDKLRMFVDVCLAIQHAHQKAIIHRDIKPSNVLVADHDGQLVPKVIDFGVSKAMNQRLQEKTIFSLHGQMIGTPTYMSPEQAALGADIDTRSDIYSLGALLYQILTGHPPFDAEDLRRVGYDEMRRVIREIDPPSPSSRLSGLTGGKLDMDTTETAATADPNLGRKIRGELDWIVMKAMEKERTARYESARSLAADVERFLNNEPIIAAAPNTLYRWRKFFRRNRVMVAATLAVAASLLASTIVSSVFAIRATKSELEAKRNLYAADMSTARRALRDLDTRGTVELLRKHIPAAGAHDFRGFEWRWMWRQTHQEEFSLHGHSAILRDLRFASNGELLASGSHDGTARIWDLADKREICRFSLGTYCTGVDFSPDAQLFAAAFLIEDKPPEEPNLILWDISSPSDPQEICRFKAGSSARFADEGNSIISGGTVYDLQGNVRRNLVTDDGPEGFEHLGTGNLTLNADGSTLLNLSQSGVGTIWDFPTGQLVGQLPQHTGYGDNGFKGVAISPSDPNYLATTSAQGVRIWDRRGNLLRHLVDSSDVLYSDAGFSNDGSLLAVRQFHGAIRVFETVGWTGVSVCRTPTPGNTLAFSPLERDLLLAGGDDGTIRAWRTHPIDTVLDHPSTVFTLRFSPTGETLAVGMDDGAVWFWDVRTAKVTWKVPASRTDMHQWAWSSSFSTDFCVYTEDGGHVAIIGPEDGITIWNVETQQPVAKVEHPQGRQFASVAVTQDRIFAGELIAHHASCGVHVWSWSKSKSPKLLTKLSHPGWAIKSLAIAPHRDELASGGWHDVRIWNTRTLSQPRILNTSTHGEEMAFGLSYSADGSRLGLAGAHIGAVVWETNHWQRLMRHPNVTKVIDGEFSEDGTRLASSDLGGNTRLLQTSRQQVVAEFDGKKCAFSPDGTILAVGAPGPHWEAHRPDQGQVTLHYAPKLDEIDVSISDAESN